MGTVADLIYKSHHEHYYLESSKWIIYSNELLT